MGAKSPRPQSGYKLHVQEATLSYYVPLNVLPASETEDEDGMPTYGVAGNHSIQDTVAADSTAQTPLLGHSGDGESLLSRSLYEGKAGLVSCVGNLANTILGTGVLAFPLVRLSLVFLLHLVVSQWLN